MRIDILKKGDEFAGIFGNLIAVKKPTGEVELTEISLDEYGCIRLDKKPKICIGYGDNVVTMSSEADDIQVATF